MLKGVFFDLDNTLYDQNLFFESAFQSISLYIGDAYHLDKKLILESLWKILRQKGSLYEYLFDELLPLLGIEDPEIVPKLVDLFHNPDLSNLCVYEDLKEVLPRLKEDYALGIITNGKAATQIRKFEQLKLQNIFPIPIYTEKWGRPKPDSYCYLKAIERAHCKPDESVYIGDNPLVDFAGAKRIGMHTLRILRGEFKDVATCHEFIDDLFHHYGEIDDKLRKFE